MYRISYLEIYNEVIFDLLSMLPSEATPTAATPTCPHAGAGGSGVCVSEDERGVVSVKGLSLRLATSEEDALNMLFEVHVTLSSFGILKFMQGQILPIIIISYSLYFSSFLSLSFPLSLFLPLKSNTHIHVHHNHIISDAGWG